MTLPALNPPMISVISSISEQDQSSKRQSGEVSFCSDSKTQLNDSSEKSDKLSRKSVTSMKTLETPTESLSSLGKQSWKENIF